MTFRKTLIVFISAILFSFGSNNAFAQSLEITTTSDKADILTGETLKYTLKYKCASVATNCTNVTMVATLPAEMLFPNQVIALTSDIASYSFSVDRRTLTFVFKEPLLAGSTGIIEATGQGGFGLVDGTVATLTAELRSGGIVGSTGTVNTTLHSGNKFCVSKDHGIGLALDYTTKYTINLVTVGNYGANGIGALGIHDVSFVDQLPLGTVIESVVFNANPALPPNTCVIDNGNSKVTCTFPPNYFDITSNYANYAHATVAVKYPASAFTVGQDVTNSVSVTYTPKGGTPITVNNGNAHSFPLGGTYATTVSSNCPANLNVTDKLLAPTPKLRLGKSINSGTLKHGGNGYYNLYATNTGNVPLDNVELTDVIPAGLGITKIGESTWVGVDNATVVYEVQTQNTPIYTPITFTSGAWNVPVGDNVTHLRVKIPSLPAGSVHSPSYAGVLIYFKVLDTAPLGSLTNCETGTTTTAAAVIDNTNACNTATIAPRDNYSTVGVQKLLLTSPFSIYSPFYLPITNGNTVWNFIYLENYSGGQPLAHPMVMDLLPTGLVYDNDIRYQNVAAADTVEVIPNYNGTGRTLVRLKWNTPLASDASFEVSIKTKATTLLPGGDPNTVASPDRLYPSVPTPGLKNTAYATGSSPNKCYIPLYSTLANVAARDIYDLNGDGSTTDSLCYNTAIKEVTSSAQLESVKWVKGECDTGYSKYPAYGGTMPGGKANYKLIIKNNGNVPTTSIEIMDVLPYVGDIGVIDPTARATQWRPNLVAPLNTPSGITVYYTTVQNPCRTDYVAAGPAGCNAPNWTTVAPIDQTTIQGLKFDFGAKTLNPGDEIELTWDMRAPVTAPTNNEIAWNSFAFRAKRSDNNDPFLPAEPNKVGIKVKPLVPGVFGNKVWIDTNKNGIQEVSEVGLDGVRVSFYRDNGDGIADPKNDELVTFTATSNGGLYLFPNLPTGDYFAVFFIPPGYGSSPANVVSVSDTLDSDGIPAVCNGQRVTVTAVTHINNTDTQNYWDQGLCADKAALGNYVWFDENSDGIQNESTTNGLNGVLVCLYKDTNANNTAEPDAADGAPIARDTTTSDIYGRPGYYLFEGLEAGKYFVKFKLATGQTFTPATGLANGSSDPTDSDPTTIGVTEVTDIAAGEVDLSWDAGIIIAVGPYKLGNLVWNDANNNGTVDSSEAGINGVNINLYEDRNNNNKPDPDEYVSATTTTTIGGIAGLYSFDRLPAGNYIVQIPDANFASGLKDYTSSLGNTAAPDPDDNKENDDNGSPVAGCGILSLPITLGANAEPLEAGKTNLSLDFGFYKCSKPNYTATVTQPNCGGGTGRIALGTGTIGNKVAYSTDGTPPLYSAAVLISSLVGGEVVGAIANPLSDVIYTIRVFNGEETCFKDFVFTIKPINCCTPPTLTSVKADTATCTNGVANTDAKVAIRGITGMAKYAYRSNATDSLWAVNATAWTRDSIQLTGLSNPATARTYTFRLWGVDTTCYNDTTVVLPPSVCPTKINLVLTKTVDSTCVFAAGQTVNFKLNVKNTSSITATGVTVKVDAGSGFTFISAAPSVSFASATGIWTIGAINAGDSAILTLTVKADSAGVNYCTAEINAADQIDINSTPNNGITTEDDIARVCVSVPIKICTGETFTAALPTGLTGIKWFKNGIEIVGQTASSLAITTSGSYTFTANESTCPVEGCCPIKVVVGSCTVLCKPVICLPVTVVRIN